MEVAWESGPAKLHLLQRQDNVRLRYTALGYTLVTFRIIWNNPKIKISAIDKRKIWTNLSLYVQRV